MVYYSILVVFSNFGAWSMTLQNFVSDNMIHNTLWACFLQNDYIFILESFFRLYINGFSFLFTRWHGTFCHKRNSNKMYLKSKNDTNLCVNAALQNLNKRHILVIMLVLFYDMDNILCIWISISMNAVFWKKFYDNPKFCNFTSRNIKDNVNIFICNIIILDLCIQTLILGFA